MAFFLKMKSINESEIQESTSPCACHVHIQHLEIDIYSWQMSGGGGPNVRDNIPVVVTH